MRHTILNTLKAGLIFQALFLFSNLQAQQDTTDLMSLLGVEEPTINYTYATFKGTRVINMHSTENAAEGALDFRISHRFGAFNSGVNNLFGLDEALIRLGFEYGINDRLMAGFGRSSVNKELDFFGKYKLLRQSTGKRNMPLSVSWFSSMVIRTSPFSNADRKNYFSSRLYYCHQLLIARKFSESLSLQLAPTVVHRNLVPDSTIANDVLALGAGGRMKMTRRSSLNLEYVYVLPNQMEIKYSNSFSIGIDVETGGHVFQMHITNSRPMNEKGFITETEGRWDKGDIQFGWNISRIFTIKERKQPRA